MSRRVDLGSKWKRPADLEYIVPASERAKAGMRSS